MINIKSTVRRPPRDLAQRVHWAYMAVIDRVSGEAKRVAVFAAPKDTGYLRRSIHIIRDYTPGHYRGGIETNLAYAVPMELGRKPGRFPPMDAIYRWVWRKRGEFGIGGGKKALGQVRSLAFLIGRAIKRHGIEGRKFFEKAEREIRSRFDKQMTALGLDIKRAWEE